ncbi:MAG: transposase [Melioribacteraceae bacterium]|nr:transposase [Melioribacteraceae bacterium]MCF8264699.1 transposase [Melioribacteraceae bacterium]MCF8412239.1 transposase [Melioribacteraceae bacterium]MCF8431121.1 transposase [Melioribacteraceae bacterium]
MSHSLTKIWIHAICGTYNRQPLIKPEFENRIFEHIKELLEGDLESYVKIINGTSDHIHILFLQNQKYSLTGIMQKIKGNTSH